MDYEQFCRHVFLSILLAGRIARQHQHHSWYDRIAIGRWQCVPRAYGALDHIFCANFSLQPIGCSCPVNEEIVRNKYTWTGSLQLFYHKWSENNNSLNRTIKDMHSKFISRGFLIFPSETVQFSNGGSSRHSISFICRLQRGIIYKTNRLHTPGSLHLLDSRLDSDTKGSTRSDYWAAEIFS